MGTGAGSGGGSGAGGDYGGASVGRGLDGANQAGIGAVAGPVGGGIAGGGGQNIGGVSHNYGGSFTGQPGGFSLANILPQVVPPVIPPPQVIPTSVPLPQAKPTNVGPSSEIGALVAMGIDPPIAAALVGAPIGVNYGGVNYGASQPSGPFSGGITSTGNADMPGVGSGMFGSGGYSGTGSIAGSTGPSYGGLPGGFAGQQAGVATPGAPQSLSLAGIGSVMGGSTVSNAWGGPGTTMGEMDRRFGRMLDNDAQRYPEMLMEGFRRQFDQERHDQMQQMRQMRNYYRGWDI